MVHSILCQIELKMRTIGNILLCNSVKFAPFFFAIRYVLQLNISYKLLLLKYRKEIAPQIFCHNWMSIIGWFMTSWGVYRHTWLWQSSGLGRWWFANSQIKTPSLIFLSVFDFLKIFSQTANDVIRTIKRYLQLINFSIFLIFIDGPTSSYLQGHTNYWSVTFAWLEIFSSISLG